MVKVCLESSIIIMDDYEKYLNSAIKFLSYRARSEKEIGDYLRKKKTPVDVTENIINFLKQNNFINDEEFTRQWIQSRTSFRPKSKKAIKAELLQKGINPQTIEKIFAGDNDRDKIDDLDIARQLIRKRIERYKGLPKQEIYQKLGGFLARRGFNWETIRTSIDEILKLEYNK